MRMALLRSSFLLLLIGLCSPTLFGTTIVIRATADYVVVGADSLWTYDTSTKDKSGKKGSIRSSGYHCKIHQFNDAFFTHAGYAGSDILQLAAQASKQGTTIEEKAQIFNELLEPRLKTDMERMRLEFPGPYREMLGTEGTVFEAAFFGMDYDRPIVALVEYKIVSPPSQRVAFECGFPGCVRVVNDLRGLIGTSEKTRRFMKSARRQISGGPMGPTRLFAS